MEGKIDLLSVPGRRMEARGQRFLENQLCWGKEEQTVKTWGHPTMKQADAGVERRGYRILLGGTEGGSLHR